MRRKYFRTFDASATSPTPTPPPPPLFSRSPTSQRTRPHLRTHPPQPTPPRTTRPNPARATIQIPPHTSQSPALIRNTLAGPRTDTNSVSPGRFNAHSRYINGLGKRREPPTKNASTVAKNRNAATTTTAFGRSGMTSRMPLPFLRHSDIRHFEIG